MEEEMTGFEFFKIMFPAASKEKLRLPDKFARCLDGRGPRAMKLQVAGGRRRVWEVAVVFDGDGHMLLSRGWEQFVRAHDLQLGYFLIFHYDGEEVLTVTVFDRTMFRVHYRHDDDGGGSKNTGAAADSSHQVAISGTAEAAVEAATSVFTAMLKKGNLGTKQEQYLNVPREFYEAHGYPERSKVVLRMRGESWQVKLKHTKRTKDGVPRASFRYGWHQFCVDNRLAVGDTCFFRVLREGGEDHVLKRWRCAGQTVPTKSERRRRLHQPGEVA